jgi:rare lipoprotein A
MKSLIAIALLTAGFAFSHDLLAQKSAGATPAAGNAPAAPAAAPAAAPTATKPAAKETADSGKAAFYSNVFNGRKTYSGVRFNNKAMVAAHRTLPMGTMVQVVNTKNKKSVRVQIIDRGPSQPERIIDLSRAAAAKLDFVKAGTTDVTVTVVGKAKVAANAPKMAKAGKKIKG